LENCGAEDLKISITRIAVVESETMGKQIISKKRGMDHGEALTGKCEVNAMLDLVKDETAIPAACDNDFHRQLPGI